MKKRMNGLLVLIIVLGWLNPLAAVETNPENRNITLEKAIELALHYNPELQQTGNQVQTNRITVNQNKANFLPDLRVSANTSRNWSKSYDSNSDRYEGQGNTSMNMGVSSSMTLFNGFSNTETLKQSKLALQASETSFDRSRQSIIFETLQRFVNVVLANELIAVDQENLEAQKLQLELVQDYYNAGKKPITDLQQQKAEISKSEYQLLSSQRNYQVYKLLLKQILGLEPNTDYQVTPLKIDHLTDSVSGLTTDDYLEQAIEDRPDLDSQKLEIEAAKKGIKIAKSGYWPTLSLFADFGTNYNSLSKGINFSDQFFDNNLNGSIGLSLSIPVFDKSVTKNSVAKAKINLKNQQLEMKRLEHQVTVEIQQAIEDYKTALKQMTVTENQLTYAKAALESIEARYKVNAATMVELTQTRATYIEAAYNRVQAKYNLYVQSLALAYYTGDSQEMFAMIRANN